MYIYYISIIVAQKDQINPAGTLQHSIKPHIDLFTDLIICDDVHVYHMHAVCI